MAEERITSQRAGDSPCDSDYADAHGSAFIPGEFEVHAGTSAAWSAPDAGPTAGPVKQTLAGKIAFGLFLVYFWGVGPASLYFNWRYANEHGFWSWLCLGQIVPTGQGFIWPYYAVSSLLEKGWTQDERDNLAHVRRGAIAFQKAAILLEGFGAERIRTGRPITPSPTDAARFLALLKEAMDESKLVRDDVLAKVHPDYPKMYREKYVSGLTRLLRVIEEHQVDAQEVATANRLLDEWEEWVHAHKKELRLPKDAL